MRIGMMAVMEVEHVFLIARIPLFGVGRRMLCYADGGIIIY
jgi:hypothetical protein